MPFRVELPRLCKIIFVLISIFMLFILIVHLLHLQALYSRQRCTCRARMNRVHNVSRKLDELCRTAVRMVTVQRCSQSSLRNMPSFYLSKVPVYLARPPEHTTRCFSKSRTVMNTTMCVKWLLQQDSTTRSHSGGGMLAKCTPLTGRTCRVSQT